jgi:hypothetical protein
MRRVVVGVIVAVAMAGMVTLIGCGQSEPATPEGGAPQAGGTVGSKPPANANVPQIKMSDAALQQIVNTVPEKDWDKLPYADQVKEYAKTHPKTTP